MKVIKKDGRIQEFDSGKILTSIVNASHDVKDATLNESDIKIIVNDIKNKLASLRKDGSPTSSYEVIGVISEILVKDGFTNVLREFLYK